MCAKGALREGCALAAEEFEFALYDEVDTLVETVKNAADGTIAFAPIPVDAATATLAVARKRKALEK